MFWDGTRWIDERAPAGNPPPTRRRGRDWLATGVMIIGAGALAVLFVELGKRWRRLSSLSDCARRRSFDVVPAQREPGAAREIIRSPVVAAILMIAAAGLLGQPWLSAAVTPMPTAAPTPMPTAAPTPTPTAAPTPTPTAAPTPTGGRRRHLAVNEYPSITLEPRGRVLHNRQP